jgi:ribosomal protein L7/L12
MRRIVLGNWKPGFNKVAMNHLLRDYTPLGLAGAKAVVDRMLEGQDVALDLDDETADDFIQAAKQLGAEVRVMDHVA